jgi:hypothetical protein
MVGVVYLAFAFAALAKPTPLWAEAWVTATLALMAVAAILAIYARRAFWGGFALVGGVFIASGLFPDVGPRLVTHRLVERVYRAMSYTPQSARESVWVVYGGRFYESQTAESIPGGQFTVTLFVPAGTYTATVTAIDLRSISINCYQQLCHAILAPVLGLAGGIVALRCQVGRQLPTDDAANSGTTS